MHMSIMYFSENIIGKYITINIILTIKLMDLQPALIMADLARFMYPECSLMVPDILVNSGCMLTNY